MSRLTAHPGVRTELGGDYRHITYAERARGKFSISAGYSFEACLSDLDAVIRTRTGAAVSGEWRRLPGGQEPRCLVRAIVRRRQ